MIRPRHLTSGRWNCGLKWADRIGSLSVVMRELTPTRLCRGGAAGAPGRGGGGLGAHFQPRPLAPAEISRRHGSEGRAALGGQRGIPEPRATGSRSGADCAREFCPGGSGYCPPVRIAGEVERQSCGMVWPAFARRRGTLAGRWSLNIARWTSKAKWTFGARAATILPPCAK